MKNFAYVSPTSEAEAVQLLGESSVALAGGSSLLQLMKEYVAQPSRLVNVKAIAGAAGIEGDGSTGVKVGANTTLTEILESSVLRKHYPALVEALWDAATPQVRNVSTLGGNLCARPPCWYFRLEAFPCRKKGAEGCPAEGGENEYMSILGHDGMKCHAVHASSAAPALIVYQAKARIAGPDGAREVELEEFFVSPDDKNVTRENVLKPNEIVTHVLLPKNDSKSATYEVRQKDSHDWPLALASVALAMDGETCKSARVCLGAVAPVPWRAKETESALAGQKMTWDLAESAAAKAVGGAKPMEKNGYKIQVARTTVKRAILLAAGLLTSRR